MTAQSHRRHVLGIVLTAIGAGLLELLGPTGPFVHAAWTPTAMIVLKYALAYLGSDAGPTVPPAALLMLLTGVMLACGGATCAHNPGPVPPADGGTLTDCSDAALHDAEIKLIPSIENALALADYASVTSALTSIVAALAVTDGAPLALAEVTCVVDWVVSKAESAHAATADTLEASKAAFGSRWVQEHGANVKPAGTL